MPGDHELNSGWSMLGLGPNHCTSSCLFLMFLCCICVCVYNIAVAILVIDPSIQSGATPVSINAQGLLLEVLTGVHGAKGQSKVTHM